MAVVGMWLAIAGYGIAYAGMIKVGGGQCSIVDGFRGRCQGGSSGAAAAPGQTQGAHLLAQHNQQAAMIGTQPISQVA